ncbi:glycosyltransferase involved in cell wall biosynthesis [Lewinella aquimaris]|uniref:Glycosyltransferase involved in cell wall biosynthesis n=1 Tax=Neolewinella aquimaris TaxID=1835722 RepID=A0A840DWG2_9BACT|nr:hypothetical protein [Neolewinella aquimaris]MBB4077524.1 glycosyltransferase involved in cell wall biosynthesis [Neolewinella aquimaris]
MSASEDKFYLHYIEAFDHTELLDRWVPVIAGIPRIQIICHVKPEYIGILKKRFSQVPSITIRGPQRGTGWRDYIRHTEFSGNCLALVATIGRKPHWYKYLIGRVPYFVVLHNLNFCFDREGTRIRKSGPLSLVDHSVHWWICRHQLKLMQAAEGYVYPSSPLMETGSREKAYRNKQHIKIPFSFTRELSGSHLPHRSGTIKIVIPGAVTSRTRDYGPVEHAIRFLHEREIHTVIHLAGRVKDERIIRRLRQVVNETPTVRLAYHQNGVSPEDFTEIMQSADVLLAPLKRTVAIGQCLEVLGTTKVSGSIYDAMHFGKPILVPHWYESGEEPLLQFSDADDLGRMLVSFAQYGVPLSENRPAACTESVVRGQWLRLLTHRTP